jgi:hypothetical protein
MQLTLTDALGILSAMITPAVLITACGSLILTTSQRLSRVIDRARKLMVQIEAMPPPDTAGGHGDEQAMLDAQIAWATQRARILQQALASLYITLSVFVGTILVIGLVATLQQRVPWLPVVLGFLGAMLLLHASVLLLRESRLAVRAVNAEMAFVLTRRRTVATRTAQ